MGSTDYIGEKLIVCAPKRSKNSTHNCAPEALRILAGGAPPANIFRPFQGGCK
jgi:hypothetical protein